MTASTRIHVLAFVGACLLPLSSPLAAQAVTINLSGTNYEVFFTTTSYNTNPDLFAAAPAGQMPWWGNVSLASSFAAKVYDQLGENVYQTSYGPVFAYGYSPAGFGGVYGLAQNTQDIDDQLDLGLGSATPIAASLTYSYAYAKANTPVDVPAPMPLFGAAAAFGWSRRLRRRLRSNQKLINSKACPTNQAAD